MVHYIYDEFNQPLVLEYSEGELFYLHSKTSNALYVPDNFIIIEDNLAGSDLQVDAYSLLIDAEPLVFVSDTETTLWFDPFIYVDDAGNDISCIQHITSWLCYQPASGLHNKQALPIFAFFTSGISQTLRFSTQLFFSKYDRWNGKRKSLFSWFFGYSSRGLVALFFRFLLYTLWFKTIGENAFCYVVDNKRVQIGLGENHDIVFEAPMFVFVKQRERSTRCFGCFSFHWVFLYNFAHFIRTYYVFNVYEYRGLLFLFERKVKKLTKRRLR